jgi:hypothetical protein
MPLWSPRSRNTIDWTIGATNGVGVPGGIPARTTIYVTLTATGDTTDRAAEIVAAMLACPPGQTVLLGPGDFHCSTIYLPTSHISNRTLRGSGSGTGGTRLVMLPGGYVNFRGADVGYTALEFGGVTGGIAKGATTLQITGASQLSVGRLLTLSSANDETLPVFDLGGGDGNESQLVTVTAVDVGAGTVTFQPPCYQTGLKFSGGGTRAMGWSSPVGAAAAFAGIEDLKIDATASNSGSVIAMSGARGCWMKNLDLVGTKNYGVALLGLTQCTITGVRVRDSIDENWTQPSHAGLSLSSISATLIEDTITTKNFPLIESQGGCMSGCVLAYNFGIQATGITAVNNHNAGDHCNLWEGNVFTAITWDGYFASVRGGVMLRNFITGDCEDGSFFYPLTLARLTREFDLAGNLIGNTLGVGISMGNASAFGAPNNGTANNLLGDPHVDLSLIAPVTRIADNRYSITLPATLGGLYHAMWPVAMKWAAQTVSGSPVSAGLRSRLSVLSMSGLTVELGDNGINNSSGDVCPTGTIVQLWLGPNGYMELDEAVAYTTALVGNNYSMHGGTIPSAEALGSTTLPESLCYAAKPAYFGALTWPPFDPTTPVRDVTRVPAGKRYYDSGGSSRPLQVNSVSIDSTGTRLTISCNKLTAVGTGGSGGLTLSSSTVSPTFLEAVGTSIVFTLSRVVFEGESLTCSYAQPGLGFQSTTAEELPSFTGRTIINQSFQANGAYWDELIPFSTVSGTGGELYDAFINKARFTPTRSGTVLKFKAKVGALLGGYVEARACLLDTDEVTVLSSGAARFSFPNAENAINLASVSVVAGQTYVLALNFDSNGGHFILSGGSGDMGTKWATRTVPFASWPAATVPNNGASLTGIPAFALLIAPDPEPADGTAMLCARRR